MRIKLKQMTEKYRKIADQLNVILSSTGLNSPGRDNIDEERATYVIRFSEVINEHVYTQKIKKLGFVRTNIGTTEQRHGESEPSFNEVYELKRNGKNLSMRIEHYLRSKKIKIYIGESESESFDSSDEDGIFGFIKAYLEKRSLLKEIPEA